MWLYLVSYQVARLIFRFTVFTHPGFFRWLLPLNNGTGYDPGTDLSVNGPVQPTLITYNGYFSVNLQLN